MSGGLHVQAGQMTQDGNNTIDSADEFLSEIRGLEESVHELLSIWRGESAVAFKGSFDGKTEQLISFKNLLEQRGENIVDSAKILDNNEQELAAMGSNLFRG